ncbi:MAG: hypothetical protein SPE87_01915, partial [Treponema porcinum]|uniref:hypothetical protein n=1 Tax=Treponema porcinum TaxID=261392 RepID=UPI002A812EEC
FSKGNSFCLACIHFPVSGDIMSSSHIIFLLYEIKIFIKEGKAFPYGRTSLRPTLSSGAKFIPTLPRNAPN